MIPNKFSMVDMRGIDLIYAQGEEVLGLYDDLVDSITLCRYQCLYNWFFDGILIPPTYVTMSVEIDGVHINEGVRVDSEDIIHVDSLEIEPVLEQLSVTENGTYVPEEGVDGFSPVEVDVQPTLESLSVTENGTYVPEEGVYGFSSVEADVQPTLESLSVTENGIYTPGEGVDGFSSVSVNVSGSLPFLRSFSINNYTKADSDGRIVNGWHANYAIAPQKNGDYINIDWSKSFKIGCAFMRTTISGSSALYGNAYSSYYSSTPSAEVLYEDSVQKLGFGIATTSATSWYRWTTAITTMQQNTWYYFEIAYDATTLTVAWRWTTDFTTYTGDSFVLPSSPFHNNGNYNKFSWGGLSNNSSHANEDLRLDFGNCFLESEGVRVWGNFVGSFPT